MNTRHIKEDSLCTLDGSIKCSELVTLYTRQIGEIPPNCCVNFFGRQTRLSFDTGTISTE